jgi:N-acetylmuramoyl-L-alanine amidase
MRLVFRQRWLLIVLSALLIVTLSAGPVLAGPLVVVIDPGHGGKDPGALGYSGTYEKTLNLDIALRLRDLLVQTDTQVIMTREGDDYLSLEDRVAIANNAGAGFYLSIHCNSTTRSDYHGTESYYYGGGVSALAAGVIQNHLAAALGTRNNGAKSAGYYVLKNTTMPAVLVETGYISNPEEESRLQDPEFRQKAAEGIFRGIAEFYGLEIGEPGLPEQPEEPGQPGEPEQPDKPNQPDPQIPPSRDGDRDYYLDIARHYARENIEWLTELGIIEPAGRRFYPDKAITRAELVTLLVRMLGLESSKGNSFVDVPPNYWAAEAIAAGKEAGLLAGYTDGTFRPNKLITRAEVSVVMTKALAMVEQSRPNKAPKPGKMLRFADADNHWGREFIYELTAAGIIKGYNDGTFRPDLSITRAETVELIARILDPTQRL